MMIVIQTLKGAGMALLYGFFYPHVTATRALYITTGAPTLALIPLGFVMLPGTVAEQKLEGTFDYIWSLPSPRSAQAASTFALFTLLALPGSVFALLVAAWRYDVHLFGRGHIQVLHSLRARTAGGGSVRAAGATSGSDTVNVVPSPTVLLTSISPPWASIIPYDTARPSPTPLPSGLVVDRKSKILARFSGRMPSPLSETCSRTTPSPLAVDTATLRSALLCVASAAFSTRFSTTCWICEGSHGAAGRSSHNVVSTATLLSFILCSTRESVMRRIRLR